MPNFTVVALKCGLTGAQIAKIGIFCINLPLRENYGVHRKSCTTKNLPACNDTIIVLKIILLHSVSVITNFVIPKRDKQRNKKQTKTSHFFVYSRRATHDPTILGMVIEEVRASFAPRNFF